MSLNVRGLAGTCTVAAFVGLYGCNVQLTNPNFDTKVQTSNTNSNTTNNGSEQTPATGATSAPASAAPTPGASAGAVTPAPTSSAVAAFACDTPENLMLQSDNTDFDEAQEVGACSTFGGSFAGDDHRFFKVTIPAGPYDGRLKVTINESNNDYEPEVRFFNAAKTQLEVKWAGDSTTTPMVGEQNVTAGKDYYFRLNQPSESTRVSVRVEFIPAIDAFERNDSFETAKALSSGVTVNVINFAGVDTNAGADVDFFKIEVPAGKTQLKLHIDNKSTAAEAQGFEVRVFKANKEEVNVAYSPNDQAKSARRPSPWLRAPTT